MTERNIASKGSGQKSKTGQRPAETGLGFGRPALDSPPAGKSTPVAHPAAQPELDEPAGGRQVGGINAQGEVAWSLSTETLFALPDSNTVTFRWNLDQDVWNYYSSTFGWTGQPRLRVRIWRW